MSRYIDADKLNIDYYDEYETKDDEYAYAYVSEIQIDSAPSIDIVRCSECKYWVSDGGALMICDIHKDPTVPEHYCSYGERSSE